MPASLITLRILTVSASTMAANCSGELATTSAPELKNFSFTSGRLSTRTISWFSRLSKFGYLPQRKYWASISTTPPLPNNTTTNPGLTRLRRHPEYLDHPVGQADHEQQIVCDQTPVRPDFHAEEITGSKDPPAQLCLRSRLSA